MIDTTTLLEELITAGTPARLVAQVATLVAEAESLRRRRAADAARQRISRDVTRRHTSSRDVSDVTPQHILPPKKNSEPKKVLRSTKHALPADFALTESDNRFALDRGWTHDKITEELGRFCNNATAKGVKYADWHAAWRNWVTSPFQKPNGHANGQPKPKTAADVARELVEATRRAESYDSDWVLPQIGRG